MDNVIKNCTIENTLVKEALKVDVRVIINVKIKMRKDNTRTLSCCGQITQKIETKSVH